MPPCNDRAAGPQHAGAERGSADPHRDGACNGSEPRRTLSVLRLPVWPRLLRRRLTRNGGHVVRKDEWRVQEVYAKGQMVRFWSQLCRFAQHAGYVIPATSARQEDTMVEGPVNWMPEARPSSPSRCSATTVRSDRVTKTAWHADSSARGRRGGRAGGGTLRREHRSGTTPTSPSRSWTLRPCTRRSSSPTTWFACMCWR